MADGNFPEEMDWFISLVMPENNASYCCLQHGG